MKKKAISKLGIIRKGTGNKTASIAGPCNVVSDCIWNTEYNSSFWYKDIAPWGNMEKTIIKMIKTLNYLPYDKKAKTFFGGIFG